MVTREKFFNALGFVESSNNQKAVSPKGAIGTFQGMPKTLDDPGFGVKPRRNNSLDEADRVTKDYMMAMLNRHDGDLEHALVSYNYGPGKADKWIASGAKKKDLPKETRDYLIKMKKALGGASMARRPLEFIKQDKLSALTKKAIKNPDSADARKVVRELIARGLPVPNKLQKTIGKARAEAGTGSPVPRPKRKPPVPKRKPAARKANKQKTALQREAASRKAEASRRAALQQLMEDSLPLDEDVAGRALDQGAYAKYPEPQRAALNNALRQSGQKRLESRLRQTQDKTPMAPPGKNPTEGQFSYTNPGTIPTEAQFSYNNPGRNPTETDLMYMIGQQRPDPSMMTPPMRRGVSRSSRPTGPVGPSVRSRDIDEDYAGRRVTDIDEDYAGRRGPQADYVSSGGRSQGRGGIDSGLLEFIEFAGGRDAFEPDALDRGLASLGGGEVDDPMAKAEATYLNSLYEKIYGEGGEGLTDQEQSFMDNFGKKKGGRLKKKKPVARKKAAPKNKKVVAKKKPVVRKKAVAKKPPMRKKTVAKKPAGRKRAAKRGFGAELRGN